MLPCAVSSVHMKVSSNCFLHNILFPRLADLSRFLIFRLELALGLGQGD